MHAKQYRWFKLEAKIEFLKIMRNIKLITAGLFLMVSPGLSAQLINLNKTNLEPNLVYMSIEKLMGSVVVKVTKDSTIKAVDEPTFVVIKNLVFKDGVIEVKVLSRLLKTAPSFARGFIGIAFRINEGNSRYESIYVRPTNGRTDDQFRRNHSVQYYSYPDYKFDRLRKESEGQYETYADMGLDEWITMRIVVKGSRAKLYLNNGKHPAFIVNDLKLGENATGAIGLWVDVGTEGYFTDLKISNE